MFLFPIKDLQAFSFFNVLLYKLCERLPNPMGPSFINCNSIAAMPQITFTIGNKPFPLSPQQVWVLWSIFVLLICYINMTSLFLWHQCLALEKWACIMYLYQLYLKFSFIPFLKMFDKTEYSKVSVGCCNPYFVTIS